MTTKNIIIGLVIVIFIVIGYEIYVRNGAHSVFGSGDVTTTDGNTPSPAPGNTDLDGKPLGTVAPTPSRSDAPGTINGDPIPGATPVLATPQPAAKPTVTFAQQPSTMAAGLPTSDTVAPNPPNGLAFGGTGKFQWYRQGDITWRVNTESGSSCIAFATMDQWRLPIVYSHGCGNS